MGLLWLRHLLCRFLGGHHEELKIVQRRIYLHCVTCDRETVGLTLGLPPVPRYRKLLKFRKRLAV